MADQEEALEQHGRQIREQASGLAEQSMNLTVHKGIIDNIKGSRLTHLNVTEEALAIERAKTTNVYAIPLETGLAAIPDIVPTDPFLYQKTRKFKTLLMEFTPKLGRKIHVAEWYKNFEYMVKTHRIPTSIVRKHMVTTTFTPELRAEYLLVREVKNLEEDGGVDYDAVRRWVYRPEIGKYKVIEQMQKIFKWKQGNENLLEAYDSYNLIVRAFIRELQFAQENGVRQLELDQPDEATLAKQFINSTATRFREEITRTCKLIGCPLNMALLKVICERVNNTKGGILGLRNTKTPSTPIKTEALLTERLERKVDKVLEIFAVRNAKQYNNWQGGQNTGGRRNWNTGREMKRDDKRGYGNNNNRGNRWNRSRRPRLNKLQWAMRKCYHCKRPGHMKKQCWDLHPHLRKAFFERLRTNKNRPQKIFVMDLMGEIMDENNIEDPVEFMAQNWNQEEIFTLTNDEFAFEELQDEEEEQKEVEVEQTPPTNRDTEPEADGAETQTGQRMINTSSSLADFYSEIVSRSQPRH